MPLLAKSRTAATLVVLVPGYLLAVTNSWASVWKLFGASNQPIAAITLTTATAYRAHAKLPKRYTLVPAVFMLATSSAALAWEAFAPGTGYFAAAPAYDLGILCVVLPVLPGLVMHRFARVLLGLDQGPSVAPGPGGHPSFR
ncbi:MAG: carbon starvation CstA 5TM domain-containing protein [Pseudodesulfovibrio sp.]